MVCHHPSHRLCSIFSRQTNSFPPPSDLVHRYPPNRNTSCCLQVLDQCAVICYSYSFQTRAKLAHAHTYIQTEQTSDVARPLDRHHGRFQLSIPGNTAAIAMMLMLMLIMLRLILVHPPPSTSSLGRVRTSSPKPPQGEGNDTSSYKTQHADTLSTSYVS